MSPPIKPARAAPRRRYSLRDPVTVSTIVIAIATVANVGVSALLYHATSRTATVAQKVFEAGNRPYIGLSSFEVEMDTVHHVLTVTANMRNYGTAPAEESVLGWQQLQNGMDVGLRHLPDRPGTIFPGQTRRFITQAGDPNYSQIMAGTSILEVVVYASYKGPSDKTYTYRDKYRFDPNVGGFLGLGTPEK